MMIDTHAHLSIDDYDNIDEIINKMGNNIIIVSGSSTKYNKEVLMLVKKYNNVYGTIGIHPECASDASEDDLKFIEENINHPKIVGVGEIGLDYYWNKENKDLQKEIFIKQLVIAKKYNKTVVIHSRDSAQETYDILKEQDLHIKSVIHCFSYSLEMAKEFIKLGSMLGIGGILTFKNSLKLKEVVKEIDLDHLLLETDSPYLSPEPYRGHKNEPYNIIYVAKEIAKIKELSYEEVLEVTTKNAIYQFDLNSKL
ncbi:MAG: TatD family hydrolase [Bacilli bacterium]|nr:TatD family hydrolase [Bacilli bacterium]MDD4809078.1 TatD family hydrolase [Bacilli bacterium]